MTGTMYFASGASVGDGANYEAAASMAFRIDGTPAIDDMPGEIVWSTTPSGSAAVVERMRLRQDGQFEIDNNISLLERAAAFGSVATRGSVPGYAMTHLTSPMFTDDTGADFVLNAGGGGSPFATPLVVLADINTATSTDNGSGLGSAINQR